VDAKLFLLLACICLPLKSLYVTSTFGERVHPITRKLCLHSGVDLAAHTDTVFAVAEGFVLGVGYDARLGRFIRIGHGDLESLYGHLSVIGVSPGDSVLCGQPIGLSGATGQVTGEHLHFAIYYQHHSIDPLAFLCGWEQYQLILLQQDHEKEHERGDR
jgi:murein DD-endopeptidase MepM/ murein hydrolase activator NlpD